MHASESTEKQVRPRIHMKQLSSIRTRRSHVSARLICNTNLGQWLSKGQTDQDVRVVILRRGSSFNASKDRRESEQIFAKLEFDWSTPRQSGATTPLRNSLQDPLKN